MECTVTDRPSPIRRFFASCNELNFTWNRRIYLIWRCWKVLDTHTVSFLLLHFTDFYVKPSSKIFSWYLIETGAGRQIVPTFMFVWTINNTASCHFSCITLLPNVSNVILSLIYVDFFTNTKLFFQRKCFFETFSWEQQNEIQVDLRSNFRRHVFSDIFAFD